MYSILQRPQPGRRSSLAEQAFPVMLALIWLSIVNLGFACEPPYYNAACEPQELHELALSGGSDLNIYTQPEPIARIWKRDAAPDISSSLSSSSSFSASSSSSSTSSSSPSSSSSTSSDASATSTSTSTSLPSPFDSSIGSNFTSSSCPAFFNSFLSNSTFRSCLPVSLLIQTSVSFFQAEHSAAALSNILDIACASPLSVCTPLMTSLASQLLEDSHCGADFKNQQPLVVQAYNGLTAYEPLFKATCLKDSNGTDSSSNGSNSSTNYCYTDAITNTTNPADVYPYYTALGFHLPATADPTCNACLQNTMSVFAYYAVNAAQPLSQTYIPCADQINHYCGAGFVDANVKAGSQGTAKGSAATVMYKQIPRGFSFWAVFLVVSVGVVM